MKDSLERMRRFYGAEDIYDGEWCDRWDTGSTLCTCQTPQRILMGRNCHKSVCHTVSLLNLEPEYIVPEFLPGTDIFADITPEQIEQKIQEMKQGGCLLLWLSLRRLMRV